MWEMYEEWGKGNIKRKKKNIDCDDYYNTRAIRISYDEEHKNRVNVQNLIIP